MIKSTLLELGMSEKDAKVYLANLELGFADAANIAQKAVLPRQTTYSILEKLVEQEFIDQSDRKGVKHFIADPGKLLVLIDKQRQKLEKNRTVVEKELPELFAIQKKRGSMPRVQYYEGVSGLKRLFNGILDYYKATGNKMFRGYGINNMRPWLGNFLPEFVKKRFDFEVSTRLFVGQGEDDFEITDSSKAYGRTVKRLHMEPQQAGMYLVGDRVYLFSFKDNVGVLVENEAIAQLLKKTFDDHWSKV